MSHEIRPLAATTENAKAILSMVRYDLVDSGMPIAEADRLVNDKDRIKRIRTKLAKTTDYMGAFSSERQLIGYSQSHEWLTGDQLPYAGRIERLTLRAHNALHDHQLPGHPLGIFAVSVVERLQKDEQIQVAMKLIADVLERGRDEQVHNEVRVGLADDEPLLAAFEYHGFTPTQQSGSPLGVPLRLYTVPLKKRN